MSFRRIRSNLSQLRHIHAASDTNREYFDSGHFCQQRLALSVTLIDVGRAVGDKKYQSANPSPCASLFDKHIHAGNLQRTGNVSISASNVLPVNRLYDAVLSRVVVQVECNHRFVAELHQSDLGLVPRDRKHLHNALGKPEHVHVPVVVVGLSEDQATRLVQYQHQVNGRVPAVVM